MKKYLIQLMSIIILVTLCNLGGASVLRVKPDGNDSNSGSSWSRAKGTILGALNAANSGDEIWVAAGTYTLTSSIPLINKVSLYGGFAGTETTRDARDWKANPVFLDGNRSITVILANSTITSSTVVSGFVIRNGAAQDGAGIWCQGSPTISNNRIMQNNASDIGGGIYCQNSSPQILNNYIMGNSAQNAGGGIGGTGTPILIGNSIVVNSSYSGGGVSLSSVGSFLNNLVVQNTSGVDISSFTISKFTHNCLYANTFYNYSSVMTDQTGKNGNISADPLILSAAIGDLRLQINSPCIDAGDDSSVQSTWVDVDGLPRIQGSHVDIGASEYTGSSPVAIVPVVRVSPSGSDSNDGSSWKSPKKSIQNAIDSLYATGGEVWVAGGTYNERILLRSFIHVYGGFSGTEVSRSERGSSAASTVLDGGSGGPVVQSLDPGYEVSTLDGFTLKNGSYTRGAGITCVNSSPILSNNTITQNNGYGIYEYNSSGKIFKNVITGNSSAGIYCYVQASPSILSNSITSNYGGGIICYSNASPLIANCLISDNQASSGAGIFCTTNSSPNIINNTIVKNSLTGSGGGTGSGVNCSTSSSPLLANNIVAFNGTGIYWDGSSNPSFGSNCVYGNSSYDYMGSFNPAGSSGNITADPGFVSLSSKNYHLKSGSSCIDKGNNIFIQADWVDIDGEPRVFGSKVDIGADEYTTYSVFSTATGYIKAGKWNLISVPADPLNGDPLDVLNGINVPNASLQYWRLDQDIPGFQPYGASYGWIGPIIRGNAYWFVEPNAVSDKQLSFSGNAGTSGFTLNLPAQKAAPYWVSFGMPFEKPLPLSSLRFKDAALRGDNWLTWDQADSSPQVVDFSVQTWDNSLGTFLIKKPAQDSIDPWTGHWLLIMDANAIQIQFPRP